MKVLLLMDNPMAPTGYGSTCRLTANELMKRGHEVYAMAFNGGPQADKIQDWNGIKVVPNKAQMERDPNAIYGDLELLRKTFDEVKPDVVFFHNDSYRYGYLKEAVLPDIFEKSIFWLPFEGTTPDWLGVALFSKFAATRFVTRHALDLHTKELPGKDVGYIPHAVDHEAMTPCPDKAAAKRAHIGPRLKAKGRQGDPAQTFVVSRVDRHQPRKYWDLTLRAFAAFAKGKDDVLLLAKCDPRDCTMFDGKERKGVDLEAMVKDLGIDDKVSFDNFFFNAQSLCQSFYHPADVFLTTTSGEGFGLAPVEAMMAGIPVICPETPVLPEVIAEGGIFCKLKGREWYERLQVWHNIVDEQDVSAKLEVAYRDWKSGGAMLADVGAKGRKKAVATYTPKIVYDQWDAVIRSLSSRKDLTSLITVLYNVSGEDYIGGTDGVGRLQSTLALNTKNPFEWIVVDNGSPKRQVTRDWMAKAAKEDSRIVPVYLDQNLGFAGGNNAGIAIAKGRSVILLNPDSEAIPPSKHGLTKDFIEIMLDRVASDRHIGIIGMKTYRRDDILAGSLSPYYGCTLITRECLEACKLGEGKWLDEAFWPAYYEDLDFSWRAMSKGFKVVEQDIPFWHKSGGTNKHMIEPEQVRKRADELLATIEVLAKERPDMADWARKRGEAKSSGMQSLIQGNINFLNKKWGREARSKIKVVWDTHIGAAVGFSMIAEGMIPALHELGFDVYVNDWSNGSKIADPLIRRLHEKTVKAKQDGEDLDDAIHIVCWLMETFLDIDASYKVGISLCESTKVRETYLQACDSMDRILTFSEFCRGVQTSSKFKSPINVIPPGISKTFLQIPDRSGRKDKYTFIAVGVAQDRKDTRRLVDAFCEAFPKNAPDGRPPECEPGFPVPCSKVELVLKSNNFGELGWVEPFKARANVRTIFTGGDQRASRPDFSEQEMIDLYAGADCLVHPSHGEGIGYPILEAAAMGMPVIFTNWSSPAEYFDESNSYPCSLSPYPNTTFTQAYPGAPGDNGQWANIHIGHMKHLMYHVIRNRDEAIAKGKKAHEHVKTNYTFDESARFLAPLLFEWDSERKTKATREGFNPATFSKPALEPIRPGDRVMIDCVTRDRHSYLATLCMSLLAQTFKHWDIIIQIDDVDESVLRDHHIMSLMNRFQHEGHGWRMIRSHRQGPHVAHDRSLRMTCENPGHKYKLMCRLDDDIFLRPDFLEHIYKLFMEDKGCELAAAGGVLLNPSRPDKDQMAPKGWETSADYAGKIDHNVPWPYVCLYPDGTPPRSVEHLYSSFMFRPELGAAIGGYCRQFSQIGHREESDFSYRFHLAGYKMLIQPKSVGFHFQAPGGGIRSGDIVDKQKLSESDHHIYERRLKKWKKAAQAKAQADAKALPPAPKPAADQAPTAPKAEPFAEVPKVAVVINGSGKMLGLQQAVERFGPWAHEIYVVAGEATKISHPKLKMIVTSMQDTALLSKALLSEGEHDFIMTVSDTMRFLGNPLADIDARHDDYVFEVMRTYQPQAPLPDPDDVLVGPEVRNECLIRRKNPSSSTPNMERTRYSDILVVDDSRAEPHMGRSKDGKDLLPLSQADKRRWTKVCTFQFPEGELNPPRTFEMVPAEQDLVSIIIPTPGRIQHLPRCLDSIWSLTTTPFEVIVVDNASEDGTREYLEKAEKARPSLRTIRQPVNLGYQKSINLAVTQAKGKYLLLFNDDAWVEAPEPDGRDWLRTLIDALESTPAVGIVGPHAPEGGLSPTLGEPMLFFWCVMLRRSTWDQVGPLDDVTFFNYGGDDDYCSRLRRAGLSVKQQNVRLRHLMNLVPESVKRPELEESRIKLLAKWGIRKP